MAAERKTPARKAAAPARKTPAARKSAAPAKKTAVRKAAASAKKAAAKRAPAKRTPASRTTVKRPTNLRAVGPNEPPPKREQPKKPKTIAEAAADGDARALLVAMQTRIAKAIDNPNCPPRDLAALTRRLHEITRDIEAIDAAAEEEGGSGSEPVPDEEWDEEAL